MAERILHTVYSEDRKRRVFIVWRDHDHFGFEEEYFSDEPFEHCWIPLPQRSFCIAATEEIAWREACGRVPWLSALATRTGPPDSTADR